MENIMKNRTAILLGCISVLLSILACNISKASPEPSAPTDLPAEPPEVQPPSSSLPTLTLPAGSGYLFDTAQVVTDSGDRDIWWNRAEIVPGNRMGSLGVLDDISQIDQIAGWILESRPFEPTVGEAFLVEGTPDTEYAIIRVLSLGDEGGISFEYLYPYVGAILP
jgi:hypothetical protein